MSDLSIGVVVHLDGTEPSRVGATIASIESQTRPPDKVVIVADRDELNGAISDLGTDIVSLARPTQTWLAHKLETEAAVFAASPELAVVLGDAEIGDSTLWSRAGFDPTALHGRIPVYRRGAPLPGSAVAFRTSLLPLLLPVPRAAPADLWVGLMAPDIGFLDGPTIVGPPGGGGEATNGQTREQRRRRRQVQALTLRAAALRLATTGTRVDDLTELAEHLERRSQLPDDKLRRIRPVMRELRSRRYGRHSQGIRSAAQDLSAT